MDLVDQSRGTAAVNEADADDDDDDDDDDGDDDGDGSGGCGGDGDATVTDERVVMLEVPRLEPQRQDAVCQTTALHDDCEWSPARKLFVTRLSAKEIMFSSALVS